MRHSPFHSQVLREKRKAALRKRAPAIDSRTSKPAACRPTSRMTAHRCRISLSPKKSASVLGGGNRLLRHDEEYPATSLHSSRGKRPSHLTTMMTRAHRRLTSMRHPWKSENQLLRSPRRLHKNHQHPSLRLYRLIPSLALKALHPKPKLSCSALRRSSLTEDPSPAFVYRIPIS